MTNRGSNKIHKETRKKPVRRFGPWIRRNIPRLFTLALLGAGSILLVFYFLAPENYNIAPTEGFGVALTNGISLNELYLGLDAVSGPPTLELGGQWQFTGTQQQNGSAYLMFVVPFHVEAYYLSISSQPKNWTYVTSETTVATIVYAMISNNTLKSSIGFFYGQFRVSKTYEASNKGAVTVVIPLELGVGGTYFSEVSDLQHKLQVSIITPPQFDVYVALPPLTNIIQSFPELTSSTPAATPFHPTGGNFIHWRLTDRRTLTVSYVDRQLASIYDSLVIIGSLAVGSGLSGVYDELKDWSREG